MKKMFYIVYDYFTFNQNKYLKLFKKLDKLRGQELTDYQLEKIINCCAAHGVDVCSWESI